jgi:uncharacterized protein YqgV (UPF0045/DUF77 family)
MAVCQFSPYPLRAPRLSPALDAALEELRAVGLKPKVGTISAYVEGTDEALFEGLKRAFRAAASRGHVVLVATVSNACPSGPGADA